MPTYCRYVGRELLKSVNKLRAMEQSLDIETKISIKKRVPNISENETLRGLHNSRKKYSRIELNLINISNKFHFEI